MSALITTVFPRIKILPNILLCWVPDVGYYQRTSRNSLGTSVILLDTCAGYFLRSARICLAQPQFSSPDWGCRGGGLRPSKSVVMKWFAQQPPRAPRSFLTASVAAIDVTHQYLRVPSHPSSHFCCHEVKRRSATTRVPWHELSFHPNPSRPASISNTLRSFLAASVVAAEGRDLCAL